MKRRLISRATSGVWRPLSAFAAVAAVLVLSACTPGDAAQPKPTVAASDDAAAREVVTLEMPEFAPVPEPNPPLTDEEAEQRRIEQADAAWAVLLGQYPNAVRPDVVFSGFVSDEDRITVHRACFEASGLQIEEGRTFDGKLISVGAVTSNEPAAIAAFVCRETHPPRMTSRGPSLAELGWIYDYFTSYYVDCLAANGIDTPPAPSREHFVSMWPNQNWFPTVGMGVDPEWDAAVEKACMHPDLVMASLRAAQ